jgi:hypothetical protein
MKLVRHLKREVPLSVCSFAIGSADPARVEFGSLEAVASHQDLRMLLKRLSIKPQFQRLMLLDSVNVGYMMTSFQIP